MAEPSVLQLGPVLRHVDTTSAAIWVKVSEPATVAVRLQDGRTYSAPTFGVHGHHYALVEVIDVQPGQTIEYAVEVDAVQVWPQPQSPPSLIRTLTDEPPSMAFGSCRTSVPHDRAGNRQHGVDALRTFGMAMGQGRIPRERWPEVLLLLGDQVYADELSEEMERFISARRSLDEPPGEELKDYAEYAQLYQVAWSDEWVRWVLSCLPSLMIFDDHDVRDDWNTSWQWRQDMEATSWWHERIVAALSSYWVYQHLGNLSVAERQRDEIWSHWLRLCDTTDGEVDLTEVLDAFAARVDAEPDSYRWSYARDMGGVRLVVVDSRAARVLNEHDRSMLDPAEMKWLDEQMTGDCEHLLIGTSLPFLLPMGLHHLESWNEAVVLGAWGQGAARAAEVLRRELDLEHWAAFQQGFQSVAAMALEVASGARGLPPRTITFLSGDVHNSYVAEAQTDESSRILQVVCSPIRNPLPPLFRGVNMMASHRAADLIGAPLAARADVEQPPFDWETLVGPWYDNNLGVLAIDGDTMRVTWWSGVVKGDDPPRLKPLARIELDAPKPGTEREANRVLGRRRR